MHCKAAGHSVAIFGLLAKTQSTCLLRVLFCTTPLPRCFLERRKSRTLASQSNLPGEQCSPLLSPADPQNSLRQKPCRRTCGGDGCCATPRATVSSLVALKRAHERPQGASSEARWSSAHPRRSKCNAEVDSECKFARTARDNAPWHILASQSNLPGEQCSPLLVPASV